MSALFHFQKQHYDQHRDWLQRGKSRIGEPSGQIPTTVQTTDHDGGPRRSWLGEENSTAVTPNSFIAQRFLISATVVSTTDVKHWGRSTVFYVVICLFIAFAFWRWFFKNQHFGLGSDWCGSVGWVWSHKVKVHRFDSGQAANVPLSHRLFLPSLTL